MSGIDDTTSTEEEAAVNALSCCASCGKAEVDDVKLKQCDGCDLVRYGDECQQHHQPEHAGKCKERAAELRDDILFRQPESSHNGDCQICFLPLPFGKNVINPCCSTIICKGCSFAEDIPFEREVGQ